MPLEQNTIRNTVISLSFVLVMAVALSCGKDTLPTYYNTDIYATGASYIPRATFPWKEQATYWKNGAATLLTKDTSHSTYANSIVVDGNNVHVAGTLREDSIINGYYKQFSALYWLNGTMVKLPSNNFNSEALAMAVANGNVYIAGYIHAGAVYWVNGKAVQLTAIDGSTSASANAITIVDNDIYVAGYEWEPGKGNVAKYWKNGKPVSLTNGTTESEAVGIAVVGSDVYVAGYEDANAKYWKNGVPTTLTVAGGSTCGIAIDGNDVYIAGSEQSSDPYIEIIKYWKNGTEVRLSGGKYYASAFAIAAKRGDVYVAGFDGSYLYWKNGQPSLIPTQYPSRLTSVFIKVLE